MKMWAAEHLGFRGMNPVGNSSCVLQKTILSNAEYLEFLGI